MTTYVSKGKRVNFLMKDHLLYVKIKLGEANDKGQEHTSNRRQ